MSNNLKKSIFSVAAVLVVIASFLYIYEFTLNIIPENLNDVSKCSEKASTWTLVYCAVAVVFLFGIDRNKRFKAFHKCIKTLNFLLVLTPVATALVDFLKEYVVKLILSVNFIPGAAAVLCGCCTVSLLIFIMMLRKYLDKWGY